MPAPRTDAPSPAMAGPRLDGLDTAARALLQATACALRDGNAAAARSALDTATATHPGHPEILRMDALLQLRAQQPAAAHALLQRALAQWPDYALAWSDLGNLQRAVGNDTAAGACWQKACDLAPTAPLPWFNLGRHHQLRGDTVAAIHALQRAHTLAPTLVPAGVLLADALTHAGRLDEAADGYRQVLAMAPTCGDAWRGLANIKTRPLSTADHEQLAQALQRDDLRDADRIGIGFALGKANEDAGMYVQAFAAFATANARLAAPAPWCADAFHTYAQAMHAASAHLPTPRQTDLGREVIFIVGLPRSGSTLFEQILAAHPQVAGASELGDLQEVLAAESARRRLAAPAWIPHASADDWQRLGRDYLARTARWRTQRPRHTDKLPENWLLAGVIAAMLPGARIIDTRRDPVETGWSCFKQQFYRLPHFACSLTDIAAYTRDHDDLTQTWQTARPRQMRIQHYEALLDDTEGQTRELLAFCGLPFAAQCLDFQHATRAVRTASAAQVRQPLRHDTARAARYGALLDPLRLGLGLPPLA